MLAAFGGIFAVSGILAFLILFFKQKSVKGKLGELFTAWCLSRKLDKNIYHIYNDVMIPDHAGGTTQIDHIVISRFGIFVIETKNMKGTVYGSDTAKNWTQYLSRNNKYTFQNPFRQDYKHTSCLAEITGFPEKYFTAIVFFVGDCKIKYQGKMPPSLVQNATDLIKFIKSHTVEKFTPETLAELENALCGVRVKNSLKNKREHIQYVNTIIESKNAPAGNVDLPETISSAPDDLPEVSPLDKDPERPEPPVTAADPDKPDPPRFCPQCGGLMLIRTVSIGAGKNLWGCSNYPECRCVISD